MWQVKKVEWKLFQELSVSSVRTYDDSVTCLTVVLYGISRMMV